MTAGSSFFAPRTVVRGEMTTLWTVGAISPQVVWRRTSFGEDMPEMENERPALVEPNASLDGRRSFSHSQTSRKERTNPLQERQIISELLPGK
jgi:hypothetical protein